MNFIWVIGLAMVNPISHLQGAPGPFLRPYALALGDIGSDGDLVLATALGKWRVDDDTDIDVLLLHCQESLEYGEVRSRFDLLPFQTSVIPADAGSWIWLRPGGGIVRFDAPLTERPGEPQLRGTKNRFPRGTSQMFANGQTRLTISAADSKQMIEDGGWLLTYQNGSLRAARTPRGRELDVTATGRYITRIAENGVPRVEIEWSKLQVPVRLWLDGKTIHFKATGTGQLSEATSEGGSVLLRLSFHTTGLVASIASNGTPARSFEWRLIDDYVRGDSIYQKKYSLQSAGRIRYEYEIQRGVIHLSSDSHESRENLYIGTKYGRVKWIADRPQSFWWGYN